MEDLQTEPSPAERLGPLASVTDAALGHLDLESLLVELLARVREILDVDTAAILLLDRATNDLVATAAVGVEEEVRQRVRVPMGTGFAGRVAIERAPLIIPDVERADISNPILREIGLRSLLGVPLIVKGELIGVLHVGSLTGRQFDTHDVELLELVAERAAMAVTARRSNVEHLAAAALQRSLIPGRLPAIPGLEIACRYLPGEAGGVGGDWYDVFPLLTGEVGFTIGDVVGRGLEAAVVMGRLRSALRAYALDTVEPAEVIRRLDRKLQHFEAGQMTTLLYGVFDRTLDHLHLSIAGHLRPVLVEADGHRAPLDIPVDPPLGLAANVTRHTTTVEFPLGALVAVFTDGLVERRGTSIENRLGELADALVEGSAERSCSAALRSMLDASEPADDVAMLVLRREAGGEPLRLRVPAVPRSLATVRTALRRWLPQVGVAGERALDVVLALGEVCANVVEHAYGPSGGDLVVELLVSEPGVLEATVRDTGQWRSSRGRNRGRGLGIIEKVADAVDVERSAAGTVVRLRFDVDQTAAP